MNRLLRDLVAGSAVLAVMLLLHLVPLGASTELSRRLLSALHAPAFATLALLLRALAAGHLGTSRGAASRWRAGPLALDGIALAGAALAGALFELAQVAGPRSAELFDLAADGCGAAGGLAMRAAWRARHDARRSLARPAARAMLALAGATLIVAPLLPVGVRLRDMRLRDAALPVLGAFEEPRELRFWESRRSALAIVPALPGWPGARGSGVGCVRLWRRSWPGIALEEPPPDWRPYRRLTFEVFHAGERPLRLHVRIDDARRSRRYDDRFNGMLELPPGPSRQVIELSEVMASPTGRDLDMSRVAELALFFDRPDQPLTVCFDEVRLEP